jgi:U6 snRNA-associated Sm-like protein LSm4
MLPLGLLNAARRQAVLVEVKSGETFNGTLLACDVWMNIRLGDVVRTDADGVRCHALREVLVRGSAVKCVRLPDNVIDAAHEFNKKQHAMRRARAAGEGGQRRDHGGARRSDSSSRGGSRGGSRDGLRREGSAGGDAAQRTGSHDGAGRGRGGSHSSHRGGSQQRGSRPRQ